jgi:hypothetical protein
LVEEAKRVLKRFGTEAATFFTAGIQPRRCSAEPVDLDAELLDHTISRAASTA